MKSMALPALILWVAFMSSRGAGKRMWYNKAQYNQAFYIQWTPLGD